MEQIEGIFRRRKLPHWDVDDKPYFVTACLEGSIPAAGMKAIRNYRDELDRRPKPPAMSIADWEINKDKLVFAFVDRLLDRDAPVQHLAVNELAEIVQRAILHFADERYRLLAWCVMPSHYHWLFFPIEAWAATIPQTPRIAGHVARTPREVIMSSIQSYTGRMCNRVLASHGRFWQHETWDHWVRDDDELLRIVKYIEDNPVKGGLVTEAHLWKWSSAGIRRALGIPRDEAIGKERWREWQSEAAPRCVP